MNKILLVAAFLISPHLLGQDDPPSESQPNDFGQERVTQDIEAITEANKKDLTKDSQSPEGTPSDTPKPDDSSIENQREAIDEVPESNPESGNGDGLNGSKEPKESEKEAAQKSLTTLLPWILAVVMSGFAGAAVVYILVLRKQDRHFDALRKKVTDGQEAVHLLPEEATRLIREFSEHLNKGAIHFDETVKGNRQDLEKIIHETEESSKVSRDQTHQTVETFKTSLNGMLEKITKFMQLVVQDTKETHNQALETKEYSKQISELVHAKEEEITKLKEGYHLQLITPLISAFLKIRDDLHLMAEHSSDTQIKDELTTIEQRIVAALSDLQIEEIEIPNRPQEVLHTRYWETLSAAETTEDPAKHGSVAKIHKRGYQLRTANSEPHVVRKAVVVVFSSSGIASQELAPSPLPNQSNPQPEEAKNHPNNLNQ